MCVGEGQSVMGWELCEGGVVCSFIRLLSASFIHRIAVKTQNQNLGEQSVPLQGRRPCWSESVAALSFSQCQ
ncbi:hypothetical protein [Bartonella silvatica]|uniref:hypothetical protein n=1 Tax=Bartonella silvatica TaxID=357760 RepID=UPI00339715B7